MDNKVVFTTDNNETVEFHVLEQTKLNGKTYLLVTDADDNDEVGNAYILKDLSADTDESAVYDVVEDEKELEAIAKIFEELLDDVQIETE
ncbi:hypothetical protein GCM10023142_38100 [Anaerocolumna aminovalerica]|uniref:DUF1292 domain-containing protein n=1 Tax=Anaerocolumna aminovalerica TaxID=1527 RepID=A0A1I5CZ64_9FIRM|nr:DUF1292 domain-containing protein [Anaerocolumna aminovalerica]MDU6264343.1 DUF1292 domain-containing protein [Anaerocolumna aminovalerica]SFN92285.1 Protein of unknown function [Anaerocolumna aminovalerica]